MEAYVKDIEDSTEEKPHVNLMICTPGHSVMMSYLKSLMGWAAFAAEKNITWGFSTGYSSHVADAREVTLSGSKQNNLKDSRPFSGNMTYDKILWIDSDIEFLPEDIYKLYKSDKDIVTGAYLLANGQVVAYPTMRKDLNIDDVKKMREDLEIEAAGFGFICFKSGVFETLSRPWFQSATVTEEFNEEKFTFAIIGEDISLCLRAKEKGFKIYLDPSVRLNHHKMFKLTWEGIHPND
jgi:hypothetical protein